MDLTGNDKIGRLHFPRKPLIYLKGLFLLIALIQAGCLLSRYSESEEQPIVHSGSTSNWQLLETHSDEFNDMALDLSKWKKGYEDDYHGVSWRDENVAVFDGSLRLKVEFSGDIPNSGMRYNSGFVQKNNDPILYGFFEARIKAAPRFPGVCSAFWLFHKDEDWWTEIDFVELFHRNTEPNILSFFRHVFRQPYPGLLLPYRPGVDWNAPWDPSDDFHIYGCEWNEQEIKWYVDGELVHSVVNSFWDQPLDITFSLELREPLITASEPEGFPVEMLVDYVRVWKKMPHKRHSGG